MNLFLWTIAMADEARQGRDYGARDIATTTVRPRRHKAIKRRRSRLPHLLALAIVVAVVLVWGVG